MSTGSVKLLILQGFGFYLKSMSTKLLINIATLAIRHLALRGIERHMEGFFVHSTTTDISILYLWLGEEESTDAFCR
jgi:hypothetical protein